MLMNLFPRRRQLYLRVRPILLLFLLLAWVYTHIHSVRDAIRLNIPHYINASNSSTTSAAARPVSTTTMLAAEPEAAASNAAGLEHGSAAASFAAPVPTTTGKVVVMGKLLKEDTAWVNDLSDWDHVIYEVDNPEAKLRVPMNKGKEAMSYLTYIIDHYDRLPSTIAFIHSHKDGWPQAWHTDVNGYSNVVSLNTLNVDFVQSNGYANLRCNGNPGCPAEIQLHRDQPKPDASRTTESNMVTAWRAMLNSTPPDTISVACCAQFAVTSKQVLQRPRSDYERYRHWLIDTKLDDDSSGRIFEYLWHVIFGRDPVYCPDMGTCYCNVYNRC